MYVSKKFQIKITNSHPKILIGLKLSILTNMCYLSDFKINRRKLWLHKKITPQIRKSW